MSANKTSTTAYGIVCGMSKLASLPEWRALIPDETVRLNRSFLTHAGDSLLKRLAGRMPPRLYLALLDAVFVPGMNYHFLFRKRWIEERVRGALDQGAQQVIVLGAGFDTLALRLAREYPEARFYEIDLPATQRQKLQALEAVEYRASPNCRFIEADLSQMTLKAALAGQSEFEASVPSLIVLEGVLMYLTEEAVKTLFSGLRDLFGMRLTVIFGALAASDDVNDWRIRLFNACLLRSETANKWHCPGAEMPAFMATLGYEVREWIGYKSLQRLYRNEADISRVPEEDENYCVAAPVAEMPLS